MRKAAPRDADANSLDYPALLVRGESKVVIAEKANDLTSMSTNYVINRPSRPLVIDSHFAIFELCDLKLVKSSLGRLVRGQGVEPEPSQPVVRPMFKTPAADAPRNASAWRTAATAQNAVHGEKGNGIGSAAGNGVFAG
jgi:hypothetical protein